MWVDFRECGELLYGRFPLGLKGAVCMRYVRPAILYGSEAWCEKISKMSVLRGTEGFMVRAMCGVQLKDRTRSLDFMLMLDLNETIDQLAMANSVCWNGHVLRREDGRVFRRALDLEVDGQRNKERPNRTWKKQVEQECVKAGLRREDALCQSKWIFCINFITTRLI